MRLPALFDAPVDAGAHPPLDTWTRIPKRAEAPDIFSYAARRILHVPAAWEAHTLKHVEPNATLVTGGIRTGKQWAPAREDRSCVVTRTDQEAHTTAWEAEYGACGLCGGDGLQLSGTSSTLGWRYRTCSRCDGTGVPSGGGAHG